ncbi:MAG: alcohol dehydrogenase catalytic domain-containing protein [Methanotrichaceae archaeon]|nr:alcohol dehydrogenase catalytic domain-containing protein [Methanotrichaceae archaeon]
MRAVVFDGTLRFVRGTPKPAPRKGESLIRVRLAGICNTDIQIMRGYMGFRGVLGHEFVGTVVMGALEGSRVVGEINCGCGICDYCRRGLSKHCPTRTTLGIDGRDGSMADYLVLPVENLHKVPQGLPDEEAVFAEPLGAAMQVLDCVAIGPSKRILVMGDGTLGLLISLLIGRTSAQVTLVGKHRDKLAVASDQGVNTVLLSDLEIEKAYDLVIEATGSPDGLSLALQLVRPRGTIVLKTTAAASSEMNLATIVVDEVHVIGSRCGPFEPAVRALLSRYIDVRPLISGIYEFDRANEAFVAAPGSLKVLIDFR